MRHTRVAAMVVMALAVVAAGASSVVGRPARPPARTSPGLTAPQSLGERPRMPFRFEANEGQSDPAVRFVARGRNQTLFLTPGEAVVSFPGRDPAGDQTATDPALVRLGFAGADPEARIEGLRRMPGVTNYALGSDPAKWRTGVAGFASVAYRQAWPGIDVVFHADNGPLEYDFVVAPGSDPASVSVVLGGVDGMSLDAAGDLVVATAAGEVRQPRPTLYQEIGGRRRPVDGSYTLGPGHRFGFEIGAYDRTRPLVIDPEVVYATYLGGSGENDEVRALAVGPGGHAFVAGFTDSTAFASIGERSSVDAFVARLSADGRSLVYATYLGGAEGDAAHSVAVDQVSGAAYVAGDTKSANFPTPGGYDTTFATSLNCSGLCSDAFAARLDAAGRVTYGTFLGGTGTDFAHGVAVGPQGRMYVAGSTDGGLQTTASAYPAAGGADGYLAVLDPGKGAQGLMYSTYIGGSGGDSAMAVAIGPGGRAYLTGWTQSSNFGTTPGAIDSDPDVGFGSSVDAFVTVLDPGLADSLVYSTRLGGDATLSRVNHYGFDFGEGGLGIAAGTGGRAYVTGLTQARDFPVTPGAPQSQLNGIADAFVAVVDPAAGSLTGLVYSTYLGGAAGFDIGHAITAGPTGHVFVTGGTGSADFPTTPDAITGTGPPGVNGEARAFVTQIDPDGLGMKDLVYSTPIGPFTWGHGVSVDGASGDFFIAGAHYFGDFRTTPADVFQPSRGGGYDGFVMRFRSPLPRSPLPPVVTGVDPNRGPIRVGTPVSLNGQNFLGASSVKFGGTPATEVVVVSASEIRATSPPRPTAGTVDVTVTTDAGTSPTAGPLDDYTFFAGPGPPVVRSVVPNRGPTAGGTNVVIAGSGFTGATVVRFGTTPSPGAVVVSDALIRAVSPPHAPGAVHVSVVTPAGTSATSAADLFEFVPPTEPVLPAPPGITLPGPGNPPGGAPPGQPPTAAPPGGAPGPGTSPGHGTAPGPSSAPGQNTALGQNTAPGQSTAPGANSSPGHVVTQAPSAAHLPTPAQGPGSVVGQLSSQAPGHVAQQGHTLALPGMGVVPDTEPQGAPRHAMVAASTSGDGVPLPGSLVAAAAFGSLVGIGVRTRHSRHPRVVA